VWEWTDRVSRIPKDDARAYLRDAYPNTTDRAVALRQAFVLPDDPDFLCVNPTDAGRFTNHAAAPTCGHDARAARDIAPGDEITMDYSGHGAPPWYAELCAELCLLTEPELARALASSEDLNT